MKKILALALISTYQLSIAQDYQVYKVKKGDTVSELLLKRTDSPLYNKNGVVLKNLKLNRLTNNSAKKLEIGSYIMLPSKEVFVKDKTKLSQSAVVRTGILKDRLSKHQNIEVSAEFSAKEIQINGASSAAAKENYKAKIKYISNSKRSPTLSLSLGNTSGITFRDEETLLVEFKPNLELESTINLYSKNKFTLSPLLGASEESNLYFNKSYNVRRDQNIWIGAQLGYEVDLKYSTLELSADIKNNIITKSEKNNKDLRLIKSSLNARINLTEDLFLASFYRIETLDIKAQELGLTFIYKL